MKRKTTYENQKMTTHLGQGSSDGLYNGLSIDPEDLRLLDSIAPAWKELNALRERILAKYGSCPEPLSDVPAVAVCILRHPHKFTDEQLSRFIEFIYDNSIIKNLTSLRMAIEVLQPRFSIEPSYTGIQPLESNVHNKTIIQILDFLSDRFAINGKVDEIISQHFLSNTGKVIPPKTIQKYVGSRKKEYPLDPFLKDKLEAIFP